MKQNEDINIYDKIEDAKAAREKAEKEIFGPFLEWYAENYPEQWEKTQKKRATPANNRGILAS